MTDPAQAPAPQARTPIPAPAWSRGADGTPPTDGSASRLARFVGGLVLLMAAFAAGYVIGNSQLVGAAPQVTPAATNIAVIPTPTPPATAATPGASTAPGSPPGSDSPSTSPATPPPPPPTEGPPPGPGATIPPYAPDDLGVFWEALKLVEDKFVDVTKLTDQNLTWGAIRGMVAALGDTGHSSFLTPDELKAEQDALNGKVIGIGVLVDQRAEQPVIVSVIDGSPAARAGLRAGDLIVAIDRQPVERLTVDQIVGMIRGPAGTTVILTIRHPGATQDVDVTLTREEITVPAVSWATVPGTDIADIRVVQFSSGAAGAAKDAIVQALRGGAKKIVVDLRGNPGGYVNEATDLASQFLQEGKVIYEERDRSGAVKPVTAGGGGVAQDVPLVVLVDFGSASSSEIFAGGIQGNQRGPIVGEQTFGTGTVLNTFTLSDGSAIRLGVVEWLTPDGKRIFGQGITPDDPVKLPVDGSPLTPKDLTGMTADQFAQSMDTQLQKAVQLLGQQGQGTRTRGH